MTSLLILGTLLVGAAVFAVVNQGLTTRGRGRPLGLGVKEPTQKDE